MHTMNKSIQKYIDTYNNHNKKCTSGSIFKDFLISIVYNPEKIIVSANEFLL